MAIVPQKKQYSVFDEEIDGLFGVFKTKNSYELNFLLTAIKIDKLGILHTANETLKFESIDFEELVQRDIDIKRVDDEIVKEYLEKDENKIMFFPPLLATLLATDDKGKPIHQYNDAEKNIDKENALYIQTWDKTHFQLLLPLSDTPTDRFTMHKGQKYYYYKHAATIKYNSQVIQFVVLDGQHRYMALKRILEDDKRELLNTLELPVCIFFSPNATVGNPNNEDITQNMRELFVRINSTAKQVSGHFLTLLNDRSLSSYCIRAFANKLKDYTAQSKPGLHLLEWNQREDRKANQRTLPYSITTVSIISNTLKDYIFDAKSGGLTEILLNLSDVENELSSNEDNFVYSDIDEGSFNINQIDTLKQQINRYITPSLKRLFLEPSVYKYMIDQFDTAMHYLEAEVEKNTIGAKQYKERILLLFRKTYKRDQQTVKDFEETFLDQFSLDDDHYFFYTNIFQQALMRSWSYLCKEISQPFNINPPMVAEALIASMEEICFDVKKRMFSNLREYTHLVIYSANQRIILKEMSKTQTQNLILSTYLNDNVRKCFCKITGKAKAIDKILLNIGKDKSADYFENYLEQTRKFISKQWRVIELDESIYNYLHSREKNTDETKQEEYKNKISQIVGRRTRKAIEILCNIFEIDKESINTR